MLKSLYVVFALALLLAMIGDSAAKSQRPSPSNRESVEPPQTQSTQTKEPAPQYPRGTEESPAFVKIIPAPDEQQRAAAETKREDEKAANDRSIALFTDRLFWATVALSVIAVGQLFAFLWQGFQLKRTVDLARKEFISTHRPKIVVRRFRLHNYYFGNDIVEVNFTIVNCGSTSARIESTNGIVYFRDPTSVILYDFDEYEGQIELSDETIPPGGEVKGKIKSIGSYNEARRKCDKDKITVYAAGRIRYMDDIDNLITTAFLRELHSNLGFRPVGDDDYEYQD